MDEDISKLIRIHKHNYSGEFGNVVVDPILTVIEEVIKNPQIFEEEEKQRILEGLRNVLHSHGAYDLLGYNLSEQLEQVENVIVPEINKNCDLLKSILSKYREYDNPYLPNILNWSISHTQSLSLKLRNIQNDDKGSCKAIQLLDFVEQKFVEDKEIRSIKGLSTFNYEIYGRNMSDVQVYLVPDGFETNVLHNIIENIHKYAFPETSNTTIANRTWFQKKIDQLKVLLFGKHDYIDVEERKVQILLQLSPDNPNTATLVIENNGIPFFGNIESVFKYGYHTGAGSGIGLFSASQFLSECGGSISMESTPEKEYKVRFIIKLPIYGKV